MEQMVPEVATREFELSLLLLPLSQLTTMIHTADVMKPVKPTNALWTRMLQSGLFTATLPFLGSKEKPFGGMYWSGVKTASWSSIAARMGYLMFV